MQSMRTIQTLIKLTGLQSQFFVQIIIAMIVAFTFGLL